jgi:hypothetical protein
VLGYSCRIDIFIQVDDFMKNLLMLFFLAFSCGANASMNDFATCVNVQSNAYQILKIVGDDKGADDYLNNYVELKKVGDGIFGESSFAVALRDNSFRSHQSSVVLDKIKSCQISIRKCCLCKRNTSNNGSCHLYKRRIRRSVKS